MTAATDIPSNAELLAQIRTAFSRNPSQMTLQLARKFEVPEVHVIRSMPEAWVTELDASRAEQLIRAFDVLQNVHVIVSNGATTLEAFGTFGGFTTGGPFLNVQTQSLDMHIRREHLASVFAVEKPGHMDGVSTLSFQFYQPSGECAFKVFLTFGGKPATPERRQQFDDLCAQFRIAAASEGAA